MKSRSLANVNDKLKGAHVIEDAIFDGLDLGRSVTVLEIGFGQGRALLELAWKFRHEDVRFLGINKRPQRPIREREHLRGTAQRHGLIPEADLAHFVLPEVFFYDASKLHFEADSVDLVYSAVTIRFVEDKARLIEEVARVLRPGGLALLQLGEAGWDYGTQPAIPDPLLAQQRSRFLLRHKTQLVPLSPYLEAAGQGDFRLRFVGARRCLLRLRKLRAGAKLNLALTPEPLLSMPMRDLPYPRHEEEALEGFRSVYSVCETRYQSLCAQGLLSPPHQDNKNNDAPNPEKATACSPVSAQDREALAPALRCPECLSPHSMVALLERLDPSALKDAEAFLFTWWQDRRQRKKKETRDTP